MAHAGILTYGPKIISVHAKGSMNRIEVSVTYTVEEEGVSKKSIN